MAYGNLPKDLADHIPVLADQGMKNVVGSPAKGVSIQRFQTTMPVGGVIVFADVNIENMDETTYLVFIQNHTDQTKSGTVANSARAKTQITVVGPTASDLLDVMIVGKVAGQLG